MSAESTPDLGGIAAVWVFDLRADVDESVLDEEERARARRFRFDRDRVRFQRRRAQLRFLLSRYTGQGPADLRFSRSSLGKPRVIGSTIHFSSSSSADVAMIAVGGQALGVDVERVLPAAADSDVARRMFAPEESMAVVAGDPGDFFRCWTRKEAYVKAIGHGLSYSLNSFAIEVADVPRPRLLRSDLRPNDLFSCTIADLSCAVAQCAAALVVQAPSVHVRLCSTLN